MSCVIEAWNPHVPFKYVCTSQINGLPGPGGAVNITAHRVFFVLYNMYMTNVILNITYVIIAHKPLDLFLKTAMIGCGRGK